MQELLMTLGTGKSEQYLTLLPVNWILSPALAENGEGYCENYITGYHCNMLMVMYIATVPACPKTSRLKSAVIDMENLAKARGLEISAEPNPADTWTAIDYTLPYSESGGIIDNY